MQHKNIIVSIPEGGYENQDATEKVIGYIMRLDNWNLMGGYGKADFAYRIFDREDAGAYFGSDKRFRLYACRLFRKGKTGHICGTR